MRNSGNDFSGMMFRDVYIQDLVSSQNFETQKSRPSVFYLNGEYYGLLNIRERYDKYYFTNLYGTPGDSIDIIEGTLPYSTADYGDNTTYEAFKSLVVTNDMANASNFADVCNYFDKKSLIDYLVTETYIGNGDWPQNNVKAWRKKIPYVPGTNRHKNDGRFRWMLFDTDFGLGTYHSPDIILFSYLIDRPGNEIFKTLLDNQNFKNDFLNRYADNLNSIFKASYAISKFNAIKNTYKPYISEHIRRWKTLADSLEWEQKCTETVSYLNTRPDLIKTDLLAYFGVSGFYDLNIINQNISRGAVKVNELLIKSGTDGIPTNPNNWTGQYFNDVPVNITAKPNPGFRFLYWIHNGNQILDSVITVNSQINQSYEIVFESIFTSNNPIPSAYNLDSCRYTFENWPSSALAGEYPKNMRFVFFASIEPTLMENNFSGFTNGLYNYISRTRVNGLNQNGFSFINTTSTSPLNINSGYPLGKLGGAVLALNTLNLDSVLISFKARTVVANPKKYGLRLQIREGNQIPFQDFSPVINYASSSTSNDSAVFDNIVLPAFYLNKPYIQLLWKYYNTETGIGARDQLGVDDIVIRSIKKTNIYRNNVTETVGKPSKLISLDKISGSSRINYISQNAIELLPNFEVQHGAYFSTSIETCDN